jgi:hypothetical protein
MNDIDNLKHVVKRHNRGCQTNIDMSLSCNCGADQAAAELDALIHKWHWICSCGYENNIPICTHCGKSYREVLFTLQKNNETLHKRLDDAINSVHEALFNMAGNYPNISVGKAACILSDFMERMEQCKYD